MVDAETHEVVAVVSLAYNETIKPVGVAVAPAGDRIYIANGRGNSVSILDGLNYRMINTVPVGERVWGIGLSADGKTLFAANGLSDDVSVIDTQRQKVVATIKAGHAPWGIAIRESL